MQRLRLKADGRIVELRDGQEFPLAPAMPEPALATPSAMPTHAGETGRCRRCATCAAARS